MNINERIMLMTKKKKSKKEKLLKMKRRYLLHYDTNSFFLDDVLKELKDHKEGKDRIWND